MKLNKEIQDPEIEEGTMKLGEKENPELESIEVRGYSRKSIFPEKQKNISTLIRIKEYFRYYMILENQKWNNLGI